MTTLVFRSSTGPLIQTQVGAADLIAAVHAAQSAYGWLSGLDSVQFLISCISNKFTPSATKFRNLSLDQKLELLPIRAHILTSAGPQELFIDNAEQCFGNDIRTQLIGLTICALAHHLSGTLAVQIFTRHLLSSLFKAPSELLHSLELQLSDRQTLAKILNEGASRGLTSAFTNAISCSGIPHGNWREMTTADEHHDQTGEEMELNFIRGLIEWVARDSSTPYFTRSGLAARVAVCLQAVGYMIGTIESWDGSGGPPIDLSPNSVVLVLGGAHSTDPLAKPADDMNVHPFEQILYYSTKTVGSLLYNSFGQRLHVSPERMQDDFEHIRRHISTTVQVKWSQQESDLRNDVQAKHAFAPQLTVGFLWDNLTETTSTERALAAIYFPSASDFLAIYYRRIADDDVLHAARESRTLHLSEDSDSDTRKSSRMVLFRALTACIVIALTSYIASDSFDDVQHQTLLQLDTPTWLNEVCPGIDHLASKHITLPSAVYHLATIHAGYSPELIRENAVQDRIIGYCSGAFSVLPTLLLKMEPTMESIGLTCSDRFYANLIHYKDGSLRDSMTRSMTNIPSRWVKNPLEANLLMDNDSNQTTTALAYPHEPWTGPSHQRTPDRPLYLSLERRPYREQNEIVLVGRIDGEIAGETGVRQVLWTILRSQSQDQCYDHVGTVKVRNMMASHWTRNRFGKPFGTTEVPAYIQVHGDNCWALLIAGESAFLNSIIVKDCVMCAHRIIQSRVSMRSSYPVDKKAGILIGFGGK